MEIVLLLTGLAIGAVIGYLLSRVLYKPTAEAVADSTALNESQREVARLAEARAIITEERDRLRDELSTAQDSLRTLQGRLDASLEKFRMQEERIQQQRTEFDDLNKRFHVEFENLANRILEDKTKRFTEHNHERMDAILSPLRDRIKDFEEKVERSYGEEKKEKAELRGEIKKLMELNQRISDEANNLASALKGDTKKQGNWGELILERIMESSGLAKGREYSTQYSLSDNEQNTLRPDVVVHLPDDRHIIIDSKVSLVAYERFAAAEEADEQARHLRAHVDSVKLHVKQLSDKAYHSAGGVSTPDFVLMFMPIESSFSQAVRADNELFSYAWDKQVVIVSPSTLLATLRTVAAIWKQDRQTKNALDIAEKSGQLYDKFVGFAEDLLRVGQHIDRAQQAHAEARKKLSEGSGNLVRRTEELRKLGAKANKVIPKELSEAEGGM